MYDHYNVTSYCLTSVDTRGQVVDTNYYKACSTDFKAWIDYNVLESGQIFTGAWPRILFYETSTTGPAPLSSSNYFNKIRWTVTNNQGLPIKVSQSVPSIVFSMQVSADSTPVIYSIRADAIIGESTIATTENLIVSAIPVTTRYTTSGSLVYETIQNYTIPVDICVPLSGWDPITGLTGSMYPHAQPLWVESVDESNAYTKDKGIPVSNRYYSFEHEIILKYIPNLSNIVLDTTTTLEYRRNNSKDMIWVQPLIYNTDTPTYKWKKLIIDTT